MIVTDCYTTGTVKGDFNVGGLVGLNNSSIIKTCYSEAIVEGLDAVGSLIGGNDCGTISSCYAIGAVNGEEYVGGLVGYNGSGSVTTCYATGTVNGSTYETGGLVGYNSGTISSCYATGEVRGNSIVGGLVGINKRGKVIRCYSTGKPTGGSLVGGLCGGKVTDVTYEDTGNFWDSQTSETTTSEMGTGLTTAEMKELSTFKNAGWDFAGETANGTDDIWRMCADGVNYPKLNLEYVMDGDFSCPDGIGFDDLLKFSNNWLSTYSTPLYGADADGDKYVNFADFAIMAGHWLENN